MRDTSRPGHAATRPRAGATPPAQISNARGAAQLSGARLIVAMCMPLVAGVVISTRSPTA